MQHIAIIGIGKLGLCYALNLEKKGFVVSGVDIDSSYISSLNNKTFYSYESGVNELLQSTQNFYAYTDISEILKEDINTIFVMVATPSLPDGSYDHSQIERISNQLIQQGKRTHPVLLVIGCTTMPGYCETLARKLNAYNYLLCYNPEFIAQGSVIHDQQFPDQVLIGAPTEEIGRQIAAINLEIAQNNPAVHIMDLTSAEICKLATNCFLTTKISFANAIGDLAIKAGADPNKILEAIGSDSRIGPKFLKYGFGFGGPCLPRDNRALSKYARDINFQHLLGEATDQVNAQHLLFQFNQYLSSYEPNAVITIEPVAYKKGSSILQDSQQLALALLLAKAGRKVELCDQQFVLDEVKNEHGDLFLYRTVVY